MRGPRITKVTCPHCGAPVSIDPWSTIWTCAYCKNQSYVHRPNVPAAPQPGAEHYGHIHVSDREMHKARVVLAAVGIALVVLLGGIGVVVALVVVAASGSTTTMATSFVIPATTSPPIGASAAPVASQPFRAIPAGPVCQKLVRCCRVVSPSSGGCDAMGILSEQLCAQQLSAMQTAARARGGRCD